MGTENHNAVIATTFLKDEVARIKKLVDGLGEMKSLFLFGGEEVNGTITVVMVPDGSKEGWPESDAGDLLRNAFIVELEKEPALWCFIEVGFGEYGQKVLRGNCENVFNDSEYAAG